jgi:predicted AlkP superfamily pyrophosphatase or phosphodiesterase
MYLQTLALIVAIGVGHSVATEKNNRVYKHVAAFSIDGLHSSDVEKYVALRPKSTIAALLETAFKYTDCYTSAPSDSYPGVAAFVSGASPRTTGKNQLD